MMGDHHMYRERMMMMAMEFHQRDSFRFRRYVALYVESSLQRRRNQKFRGPTSRRPSWALTSLALIQVDCRLAQIIKLQAELRILEILFATTKTGSLFTSALSAKNAQRLSFKERLLTISKALEILFGKKL